MTGLNQTKFIDLPRRERKERDRLTARLAYLETKSEKRNGSLPSDEQAELQRLKAILAIEDERIDALFVAVRELFNAKPALISSGGRCKLVSFHPVDGTLKFDCQQIGRTFDSPAGNLDLKKKADKTEAEAGKADPTIASDMSWMDKAVTSISLVMGILADNEAVPPRVIKKTKPEDSTSPDAWATPDTTDPVRPAFVNAFYNAIGEADKNPQLALMVLSILDEEGDPTGNPKQSGEVECIEFARVMRCLIKRGVTEREPQLRRRVNECLNKIQQVGEDKPLSDIGIALPDLNQVGNYQIQEENVRLMGPIICAAMFEELKVFQVIDKLVEQSQNGMLVTSRGPAGEMLYNYWKDTPNRMSESERANLYSLTLGIPGGDGGGVPNREFNDLWSRFVSSVSSLVRQRTTDSLLRATLPAGVSQQQVRKTARDLALNLSSRGYGMALYLALDLQAQINMSIQLLSDREIMSIYGARDMWQVIDQVATLELGGARNSARYRTLATCGAIITAWLANNVKKYNSATSRIIIDLDEVMSIDPPSSSDPTRTPTDYDLVNACELWLADTATPDERIEELSQPREAPMMTSRPVQIPSIARDMLESAGVAVPGFGMGAGIMRR